MSQTDLDHEAFIRFISTYTVHYIIIYLTTWGYRPEIVYDYSKTESKSQYTQDQKTSKDQKMT